jgi:hypothetical protein
MKKPRVAVSETELPAIRVEDWSEDPPLAVRYICGENELDLETVYAKIKRLTHHLGRGRLEMILEDGTRSKYLVSNIHRWLFTLIELRVKECDSAFTNTFWECLANLFDYFADFLVHDTVAMQSVWFHLLDVLQEAGDLPHAFWEPQSPSCSHAQEFAQFYEQALAVINTIIMPKKVRSADALVHPNDSLPTSVGGRLGGFKAGLKPWQQFLYIGSPGLDLPANERVYMDPGNTSTATDLERFVPMGALGIIQAHTERYRALVAKHLQVRYRSI